MHDGDTLYDILGIEILASADDVRKAYRKLALKWHPGTSRLFNIFIQLLERQYMHSIQTSKIHKMTSSWHWKSLDRLQTHMKYCRTKRRDNGTIPGFADNKNLPSHSIRPRVLLMYSRRSPLRCLKEST